MADVRIYYSLRAAIFVVTLLLTGCSTPLSRPVEGWWSEDRPARPAWPANRKLLWAARRPLAHDTLIHEFVRELLAQGRTGPNLTHDPTVFYLGSTLFERAPQYEPQYARCRNCYTPDLSENLLQTLVGEGILHPTDTVFMQQQLRGALDYRLTQNLLRGYQIIPIDTVWAIESRMGKREVFRTLRRRYHTWVFFYLSLPLFSRDRQTVIVNIDSTDGLLGGDSTTYVVCKQNNRWRILRQLLRSIS